MIRGMAESSMLLRLSNALAQKVSGDHMAKEKDVNSSEPKAPLLHSKTRVVRGAGPELADATGFHLVNVFVHATTCSSSLWLFRAVFAGEELPAVAASLLFTLHPVHVEAVAPIVGRADLLCGFLSVIALSLTIAGTRATGNASGNNGCVRGDEDNDAAAGAVTTPASCSGVVAGPPTRDGTLAQADIAEKPTEELPGPPEDGEQLVQEKISLVAAATIGTTVFDETRGSPTSPVGQMVGCISSDEVALGKRRTEKDEENKERGDHRTRGDGTMAHGWGAKKTTSPAPPSRRSDATETARVEPEDHTLRKRCGAGVAGAKDTGPGVSRFCAALLLAAGATLCKEVGVTVFGLMAGGEVVLFLEERNWRQRQRQQGPRSAETAAETPEVSRWVVVRECWWCRSMMRVRLASAARAASAAVGAATMVIVHVRLHGGAGVREWGVLENDISILASRKERALSYAFTHAVYAYKLLWPAKLCYDWGYSCIPHVTSLTDMANLGPLTLYASILWAAVWAVVHHDPALIWGLSFLVVPFLPASNLLFPVGAVMAERLLYLPSLGACVLAGDWKSERALFESALEVCPDGIKTLNNVAVGMLNEEEAGRAEVYLRRAVKLHPEYGFAMFNLGVSLMIKRDLVGAVSALERSRTLEPRNTKIMVYLGKVYLELTSSALENPSAWAEQGNGGVDFEFDGTHRDGGRTESNGEVVSSIRFMSPELLLSSAEMYVDQALAAGSGLPLARLIKGQALALRGQHQSAAEFFRVSIDISLDLLAGRSTSGGNGGGGKTERMEVLDAVDLGSTYNRLGLALRDAGSDVVATKEVFLAGLSAAPDDLPLLVNGGVAHQAAGDIPGAKALYQRALSLQPNSPELLNNVGYLEEQTGGGSRASMEKAAAMYARALVLLDAGSPAHAQVEINLKNSQKALTTGGLADAEERTE
eukprot:g11015.t1